MPRIEIYLTTAFEISHWASIVRALMEMEQDVSFVSPQTTAKSVTMGWDDADRTEELLRRFDLPWTKQPDFSADCVLTIQSEDFVHDYRHTKMRMTYGVGLIPPATITNSGGPFDYHLVHGPFNQRVQFRYHALSSPMLPADRVKVIGYPRFDHWFSGTYNIKEFFEYMGGGTKQILLWLPTWGRSSSIDRYADAIFALKDKYDIWVKPHHGTVHWERDRMEKLAEGPCRIIDFTDPPEPAVAAASVVLADLSSGAFSEAVFLKKRVIGLATQAEVDQVLLPTAANPWGVCLDPVALDAILNWRSSSFAVSFDSIRSEIVDSTEGADGMRAARIIVECVARAR